ncbi:DUF1488 family protein [Pandoraea sputorum]|uniref:DUF1488 domain-containing protein n=1 Tax=Pandoraea sputorum TaxID=93222 RepID=UPI00123EDDEC|nr:DUF1488 domain-containing protein [Pandoraea sputorum]VVE58839.1 hypothetical protein PSP20601_05391 [Pandoraea sputorum]
MEIDFPHFTPVYNADDISIEFLAQVDGKHMLCAISAEALEDHFGATSCNVDVLTKAFEANRSVIEQMAAQYLRLCHGTPVLLRSGHFRWATPRPT